MLQINFLTYLKRNWILLLTAFLLAIIIVKYTNEAQIFINKILNTLHYDPTIKSPMELKKKKKKREGIEEIKKILKEQQEERERNDKLAVRTAGAILIVMAIIIVIITKE